MSIQMQRYFEFESNTFSLSPTSYPTADLVYHGAFETFETLRGISNIPFTVRAMFDTK